MKPTEENKVKNCFKLFWRCLKKKETPEKKLEDKYLEQIEKRIKWYHKTADRYKIMHNWIKTIIIAFSAFIPVLALAGIEPLSLCFCFSFSKDLIIVIIGALITILSGVLEIYKLREKRMKYRTAANELEREKQLFLAGVESYRCDENK
jgi:hypothetical protein